MAAKMGRCTFAVLLGIVCFSCIAKSEEVSHVVIETQKGLSANATNYKYVADEEIDAALNDSSEIFPAGSESNFDIEDEFILVPKANKSIEGSIFLEANAGTIVQSELSKLNESSTYKYDDTSSSVEENVKLTTNKRSTMQETYSYTNSDDTLIVETNTSSTDSNVTLAPKVVTLAQYTDSAPATPVPSQVTNISSREQSNSSSSSESTNPTLASVDSANVTSAENGKIGILDNSTTTTAAEILRITDSSSVESSNSSEIINQTTASVESTDPTVDSTTGIPPDNTNDSTITTAPDTSRTDSSSVDLSNSSEAINQTTATDPPVVPNNETTVDDLNASTITPPHDTSAETTYTDVEISNTSNTEPTNSTTESFNSTGTEYITNAESTTSSTPGNLQTSETDPVSTHPTDATPQSTKHVDDLDPTPKSTLGHSSVKLAISITFLLIASIAAIVLIVYMIRMRRRAILYDELRLLP